MAKAKKRYYLAYGSNLNIDQMRYRCPSAKVEGVATLNGWRLLFRGSRSGAYLTIERCPGERVPVGVWSISPSDEKSLDRYEGYPSFYRKETLHVHMVTPFQDGDRDVDAMVYIMDERRPIGVPHWSYVDTVADGYDDFGFDINVLRQALCFSGEEVIA